MYLRQCLQTEKLWQQQVLGSVSMRKLHHLDDSTMGGLRMQRSSTQAATICSNHARVLQTEDEGQTDQTIAKILK
jgi:hypothetical protein